MAGHNIRLILTDIDGTILPYGRSSVSQRTREAFHAALEAGIRIGPASGRGFSHIPELFGGDAACSATCLATNGMEVFLDGKLIRRELVPREPLVRVAETLADVPHAGLICFENGIPQLVVGNVDDLAQTFPVYARQSQAVDDVPNHNMDKANVFVAGSMQYTREVKELLLSQVNGVDFDLPMKGFLNIMPPGWSKASGIDVLCAAMDIAIEQVVVFGDGGNDVAMLAHVPNSAVVRNAAPEAAAVARWQLGSCEDESVTAAIEQLAAGDWPFAD